MYEQADDFKLYNFNQMRPCALTIYCYMRVAPLSSFGAAWRVNAGRIISDHKFILFPGNYTIKVCCGSRQWPPTTARICVKLQLLPLRAN